MSDWSNCKNILLVRLDNMGDVIMSNPSFMQIRLNFPKSKITLLTSSVASPIIPYLSTIDDAIIFDCPWMKNQSSKDDPKELDEFIQTLKQKKFDACIIFNVYSQNILPAALLCYMANIPIRAAYCRENPYHLLTHWIPDPEPLQVIHHQVTRDLLLLKYLGFPYRKHNHTYLYNPPQTLNKVYSLQLPKEYLLINLDVSEEKRQIPLEIAKEIIDYLQELAIPLILIGKNYTKYFEELKIKLGNLPVLDLVGRTTLDELLILTKHAKAIVSVNTGVVHIACAYKTPILVLYADTNPQHTPWSENSLCYTYSIEDNQRSKNEIIKYVHEQYRPAAESINAQNIYKMFKKLLASL
jgi:ADP-heptose:LPS heptosyltransferase